MNNPEFKSENPSTKAFLSNPGAIAHEIERALNSGNLAPEFVEEKLTAILEEARNVNAINDDAHQQEMQVQIQTLEQKLLTHLATIEENKESLRATLIQFCKENNLELYPKHGDTVAMREDLNPSWTSSDGQIAIKITPNGLFTYSKIKGKWMADPLTSAI